jgi:hypothetical protein
LKWWGLVGCSKERQANATAKQRFLHSFRMATEETERGMNDDQKKGGEGLKADPLWG